MGGNQTYAFISSALVTLNSSFLAASRGAFAPSACSRKAWLIPWMCTKLRARKKNLYTHVYILCCVSYSYNYTRYRMHLMVDTCLYMYSIYLLDHLESNINQLATRSQSWVPAGTTKKHTSTWSGSQVWLYLSIIQVAKKTEPADVADLVVLRLPVWDMVDGIDHRCYSTLTW